MKYQQNRDPDSSKNQKIMDKDENKRQEGSRCYKI